MTVGIPGHEPKITFTDNKGVTFITFDAAAKYYGITLDEVCDIFNNHSYENPATVRKSQVIKRLRSLAKHYKDNPV